MLQWERTALDATREIEPTASNIERLCRTLPAEEVRWAFAQWKLRARARAKFARADEMLFQQEALEQATHEIVASYHASRFPAGELVIDMTCGIGADTIALAARGQTVSLDTDPERCRYALHNVGVHGHTAQIIHGDSLAYSDQSAYYFCDPARRVAGRRTLRVDEFTPNIRAVIEHTRSASLTCIKLSPMLSDQELNSLGPSIEFVSYARECREAIVWIGPEAQEGRWAVLAESGDRLQALEEAVDAVSCASAWVMEADPAAIRAHCLGRLAKLYDLAPLGDSNGFLTGDQSIQSPWITVFEVITATKANPTEVRRCLRELRMRLVSVKPRGVDIDPSIFLKTVGELEGDPAELLVWRASGRVHAAICRRI